MPVVIIVNIFLTKKLFYEAMLVSIIIYTLFSVRLYFLKINKNILWIYILLLLLSFILFFVGYTSNFEIFKQLKINESLIKYIAYFQITYIAILSFYSILKKSE
jgi:hypothetical protein